MNDLEIKIVTLSNDIQLVALVEDISETEIRLLTPLRISRIYRESEKGMTEQFSLMNWIPFSDDIDYYMNKNLIINIATLSKTYVQDYHDIVEKTFFTEASDFEREDPEIESTDIEDLFDFSEAVLNNKLH